MALRSMLLRRLPCFAHTFGGSSAASFNLTLFPRMKSHPAYHDECRVRSSNYTVWPPGRFLSTNAQEAKSDYVPIYRLSYMRYLRVVSRFKLFQTLLTVCVAPPIWYLAVSGHITEPHAYYALSLATFALGMLYAMSLFLRRIIGFMYLHRDGNRVKIAHMTFWGTRRDIIVPTEDVVPLNETGDKAGEIFYKLKRYGTNQELYFTLRYGQVVDAKRFSEVFGDIR